MCTSDVKCDFIISFFNYFQLKEVYRSYQYVGHMVHNIGRCSICFIYLFLVTMTMSSRVDELCLAPADSRALYDLKGFVLMLNGHYFISCEEKS